MNKPLRLLAAFGVVACSWFALPVPAQGYRIVDLGADVFPSDINDSRIVVGNTFIPPATGGQAKAVAFVWREGVRHDVAAPGYEMGSLVSVNVNGVAVGAVWNGPPGSGPTWPAIYRDGVLSPLPYGAPGVARTINDAERIGGALDPVGIGGFSAPHHPFVASGSAVTVLADRRGYVSSISPTGIVAGGIESTAVTWQEGVSTVLPFLQSGTFASVRGANRRGQVVGGSTFEVEPTGMRAVMWEGGTVRDLGGPADTFMSEGIDVNDAGHVVGYVMGGPRGIDAFLYRDGAFRRLDEIAAETGWWFEAATSINERGDIVGSGSPPGSTSRHGFVLLAPQARTIEGVSAELAAAIEAFGLAVPRARAVLALLRSSGLSAGANAGGVCSVLGSFAQHVAGAGLPPADVQRLHALATELSTLLRC